MPSRITHSRQLTALAPTDSGGVALRFADGSSESADMVVLAVPPALLADIDHGGLLNADWQAFASEVRLGRNEKLNAAYSARPWTETMGAWGASWDASEVARFVEVWDATAGDDAAGAVLTWFFGGDQVALMSDPALRATVEAAMGSAMGDLAAAAMPQSARTGWSTAPFARGAYVNFAPGQFTRFGGLLWLEEEDGSASQIARSGPILFAGEHVSDAFPGYMNGAAQTGRLAAQAIMAEVAAG